MSILKIVGTETELRLDRTGLGNKDQDLLRRHPTRLSEEFLPSALVDMALEMGGPATVKSMERDAHSEHSHIAEHIQWLKNQHDPNRIDKIIEEHLFSHSPESEDYFSEDNQLYQHFGFSGGYLPSGHRIYVDGSHPEVCTPECSSPLDLVCWEKAGMAIIEKARQSLCEKTGDKMVLYKNNSDGFGSSWGAHENYLITNELFSDLVLDLTKINKTRAFWITFLITRYIYTGAGKLGIEPISPESKVTRWSRNITESFLLSSRAQFMTSLISLNTMSNRAFINTRDIPYVGRPAGRRLHVIAGDANMCDMAMYLKVGMAMIMLMTLEDLSVNVDMPVLINPLGSLEAIVFDLELKNKLWVELNGKRLEMTTVEIQEYTLKTARRWYETVAKNNHPQSGISWIGDVLNTLEKVLDNLRHDPELLYGKIDWVTKRMLMEKVLRKYGHNWNDVSNAEISVRGNKKSLFSYLRGMDMAYHRLDSRGIFSLEEKRNNVTSLISADQLSTALIGPPENTRAFDRVMLAKLYGRAVRSASWEYVVLADGPRIKIIDLHSPWRRLS